MLLQRPADARLRPRLRHPGGFIAQGGLRGLPGAPPPRASIGPVPTPSGEGRSMADPEPGARVRRHWLIWLDASTARGVSERTKARTEARVSASAITE